MNNLSPTPKILTVALLVLSTLIVFEQTRGHDYIEFDDARYVSENPIVQQGLTWSGLRWAFSTTHMANWHPLTWVSHMVDVDLFGLDAGWHHLVSMAIHGANAILLFLIFCEMTGALYRSGIVAVLFAVHPLHVESVAWVAERKDLLCAFFFLLAMGAYVRYARRPTVGRYLWIAVFLVLSLMSKPMAVTLPFVLLLLDWWPLERLGERRSMGSLLLEKVPLMVLSGASCVVTYLAQQSGGAVKSFETYPPGIRAANAVVSYTAYLAKTVWPSSLAVYYPYPWGGDASPMWWKAALASVILAGATTGAILLGRRYKYFAVGWFWYLGMLVPVIGLVQVGGQAMADRYTYLPLVGIFLIGAWGIADLLSQRRHRKAISFALGGVALVALTAAARVQAGYWHDSVALFSHALSATENNFIVHNNLGTVYIRQGDMERAEVHFREALRIHPGGAKENYNVGNVLVRRRQYDAAAEYFRRTLQIDPDYTEAHYYLGVMLCRMGLFREGVFHLEEVLRRRPNDPVVSSLLKTYRTRQ